MNVSEQSPPPEGAAQEALLEKWHALESAWRAILMVEASIETLRLSMDGLRGEMDGAFNRQMSFDERMNAMQADVAQWTAAKNRIHDATPKTREFVHRATMALTGAERKRLGELHKSHIEPRIPFPEMDAERERLEHLLKDRQVLLAQGNAANQ